MRTLSAFLPSLLACACVSVNWTHDSWATPTPKQALAEMEVGVTSLSEVLGRLGAPLQLWEHRRDGLVLAYGWRELDA